MQLELTEEQQRFQLEMRAYFNSLVEEIGGQEDEGGEGGVHYKEYIARLGDDGMLGLGWPKEYGGKARPLVEQLIFVEESHRAGVPLPLLTLNSVGPTIMAFGTEEQKQRILPEILKGRCHFAIGYSEPGAGTDLASLQTRAELDGDEWVINGQKVFTSVIHYADYVWLAVRTDPDAPKHKGISVIIVPTDAPGFSWTPIHIVGGGFTSATYYDDVRVPKENLVGELNGGWRLITNQLNYERLAITPSGSVARMVDDVRKWAGSTKLADGTRVIDQQWVQTILARCWAKVEVLRLMNWRAASASAIGAQLPPGNSSATKVYGTELYMEVYRELQEIVGQAGYVVEGSPGAVLQGGLEKRYRGVPILTFGGGTNEVQRDIIAMAALGMPRAPR
jgi:alkylation response protein AidB-like acyl-CoA dehydrogenase